MCTRAFWSDNGIADLAVRTMDWSVSDEPKLWWFGAGIMRSGGTATNAYTWESAFSSIQVSGWDAGVTDGLNEAGLGVHLLYLEDTNYETSDNRPTVSNLRVVQLLLDTCASVSEALSLLERVRIESVGVRGLDLGIHLALEDSTSDSAIVEVVDGELVVHHGEQYTVLANDPTFDEQLNQASQYRPFGGELGLPGDILSEHRFVRASYFLHYLPQPNTYDEALAAIAMVGRNVSVPPGAPYDDFSVYPTWWMSITDVTERVYYFQPSNRPNLFWVELGTDRPHHGEVRVLDPQRSGLVANVSDQFDPSSTQQL